MTKSILPWNRLLLEKLLVAQVVKKFPAYVTQGFIVVLA
jgi:hypothetical protein